MKRSIKAVSLFLSSLILITSISLTGCAWWLKNAAIIDPVASCLVNALAEGAITDPLILVSSCAGATLEALAQVLKNLISSALPATDSGVATEISPYVVRLLMVQQHTNALMDAGVK